MKLWNRNFSRLFVGMIFSAVGGIGLNIALSVVVFSQTQSTVLTAIFSALSMLPQLIFPLFVGSFIDRRNPLRVLLRNEVLLACLFFATALLTHLYGFSYPIYLVFSLLVSCFDVVSNLCSDSIIPQVMPKTEYQRGNAILTVIYPLCSVVVAPVTMLLFERFGMTVILAAYGLFSLIDAAIERGIDTEFVYIQSARTTLSDYGRDLKSAFKYFRNDRAVRAVFLTFALVMLTDASERTLMYPFFNQHEVYTNTHYALMSSIRSAGYMVGGFLHYFIHIPEKRRYPIAVIVYFTFILLDAFLFLMPFSLICASRFLLGILGMNSANIRVSSIQAHVPDTQRAKLNALYSVLTAGTMMIGQLLVGVLGEIFPYWMIQMSFQGFYLLAIFVFILPPKNGVKALYNYSGKAREGDAA